MNPMNLKNRNRPVVDILFLLALFSVFLISALFIVLFGARIYRNTASGMNENFKSRTVISYITEKIRQHDHEEGVSVIDYNGTPVLRLADEIEDSLYYTYLYEDDGYLAELTAKSDFEFNKSGGQKIVKTDGFTIEAVSDALFKISLNISDGQTMTYYVSMRSNPNPAHEEVQADE